jgi:hypothetical protein
MNAPTISTASVAKTGVKAAAKDTLDTIWKVLEPVNMSEIVLFVLVLTAIYIISALWFYNTVQLRINNESQCYLAKQSVSNTGSYIATATNENGNKLYKVVYNMPAKSFKVECACTPGNVTNTYPNIDVYNLQTQQTMRIANQICPCDKQYYVPGYDKIYYSGYPGITRFMNTASTIQNDEDVQTQADTSFFQAALNPTKYYNTY